MSQGGFLSGGWVTDVVMKRGPFSRLVDSMLIK